MNKIKTLTYLDGRKVTIRKDVITYVPLYVSLHGQIFVKTVENDKEIFYAQIAPVILHPFDIA